MASKLKKRKKGNKICAAGIAWAKRTFDTYPSAYANMAASKYCKDPNYAKGAKKKKLNQRKLQCYSREPILYYHFRCFFQWLLRKTFTS